MLSNSYLKLVVIIFFIGTIASAVYTAICGGSYFITFILFIFSILLNIVDAIVSKKDYEKNVKSLDEQINSYKRKINKK